MATDISAFQLREEQIVLGLVEPAGNEQRKLAAIMFTDMVGYSALTQENEALALELLEEHRRLLRALIPAFNGSEVETTGDGFLVTFVSALEAARCAIEIQRALATRNLSAPAGRHIRVRIGIHVGDVVQKNGHVLGDGVNIAARLQPLAQPGGICISVDVARQVQQHLDSEVVTLGPAELKNIRLPMEIWRIVLPWETDHQPARASTLLRSARARPGGIPAWACAGIAVLLLGWGAFFIARRHSTLKPGATTESTAARAPLQNRSRRVEWLAVLPLRNLTGDTNQDFFVEGMTDLLTTELSHIGGLQVKSFTTAMTYQGTKKPASEIGRELNVDALVEGSMQRDANQIILNVKLINTADDRQLWSKPFRRALEDVWKIKGELAELITSEIRVSLTPEEQHRLATIRTRRPEAVEQYLKGRYLVNRMTDEDLSASTNYFLRALEIEPDWAEAYAGQAQAYVMMSSVFRAPREVMPLARSNAIQALRFDENLAEAHFQLGFIGLLFDYRFAEAEPEFKRALALNPNSASAHDGYAQFLTCLGRLAEAIAHDETAYRLDPKAAYVTSDFVSTLLMARQYERAVQQGLSILKVQEDNHLAAGYTALAYALLGRTREAIELLEPRCTLKERPPMTLAILGYCYALAEQTHDARRTAAQVERIATEQYVCGYEIATIYAALGDADAAFHWLDKAFEDRADCIPFTKVDPRLDKLRSDPRFNPLLRRIGFTLEGNDAIH